MFVAALEKRILSETNVHTFVWFVFRTSDLIRWARTTTSKQ
jgi:hypothetical protein